MSDEQFEKLIEKDNFSYIVSNIEILAPKSIDCDSFDTLENEIKHSIQLNTKRKTYST